MCRHGQCFLRAIELCWIVLSEAVCLSTSISGPLYSSHIVENICSLLPFKVRFGPCDLTSQWHGHRCQASFLGRSPKGQSSATRSLSACHSSGQVRWWLPACLGPRKGRARWAASWPMKNAVWVRCKPWAWSTEIWGLFAPATQTLGSDRWNVGQNSFLHPQAGCGGEGFLLYLSKSPHCSLAIYLLLSKLLAILWPLTKKR